MMMLRLRVRVRTMRVRVFFTSWELYCACSALLKSDGGVEAQARTRPSVYVHIHMHTLIHRYLGSIVVCALVGPLLLLSGLTWPGVICKFGGPEPTSHSPTPCTLAFPNKFQCSVSLYAFVSQSATKGLTESERKREGERAMCNSWWLRETL